MTFAAPSEDTTYAGTTTYRRPARPYDQFMAEQELPIYRSLGVRNVRELELKPWSRMGGKGAFIQTDGTEGQWGMYVLELPGRGATPEEKHLYEEIYFVVDGRGSTEVRLDGSARVQRFEWQAGSMFAIPPNARHRVLNSASDPALLLAATNAPPIMNIFKSYDFIFDNPVPLVVAAEDGEYYKPPTEILPDPVRGRAMWRTNLIPDVVDVELPLDNERSPGYRRVEPHMATDSFFCFIGQHEPGRYSKAHRHPSGAVLICIKGEGYTYTWPRELGMRPWEKGQEDQVRRQEYVPVGMVSAAPGGGDWYHQHFATSAEGLRLLVWDGSGRSYYGWGAPGEELIASRVSVHQGGRSIDYEDEDPHIRAEYVRRISQHGVELRMPSVGS